MKPQCIKANGLYAITLEFASGMIDAPFLDTINSIIKEEGARIHLVTSQKIMILDLSEQSAKRAREKLDAMGVNYKFPKQISLPRVCVGSKYCKFGLSDTLQFGERIYKNYAHTGIPYKIKVGVSGCRASCAHSTLADIGFIGRKSGYEIYVGGKAGINPKQGKLLSKSVNEDTALQIIGNIINLYCKTCDPDQKRPRVFHTIEKTGFEEFKIRVLTKEKRI